MSEYTFDKEKHLHLLDGKPLSGCTTVLSVIAKPMLIQWAANMACDYINDHCSFDSNYFKVTPEELKEARVAHRNKKEKAGDWGTAVHAAIEDWIKEGKEPTLDEKGMEVFGHFLNWSKGVKFLESERNVWSEKLWLGGIVDLVVEINGQVWIADIKTSTGIYEEAFYQMAGYHLMLKESYPKVKGYIVLNLRKDGLFEEKRSTALRDHKRAFLAALTLYRIKNKPML